MSPPTPPPPLTRWPLTPSIWDRPPPGIPPPDFSGPSFDVPTVLNRGLDLLRCELPQELIDLPGQLLDFLNDDDADDDAIAEDEIVFEPDDDKDVSMRDAALPMDIDR